MASTAEQAEFADGQAVAVDDPGMGYSYNAIVVGREPGGIYIVMAADDTTYDHKAQYLTSLGWSAF